MNNFNNISKDIVLHNLIRLNQLVFEVTDACNLHCKVGNQARWRRKGSGIGLGTVTAVLRREGRDGQTENERIAFLCQIPLSIPERIHTAAVGNVGRHTAAIGVSIPYTVVGGCGYP